MMCSEYTQGLHTVRNLSQIDLKNQIRATLVPGKFKDPRRLWRTNSNAESQPMDFQRLTALLRDQNISFILNLYVCGP